MWAFCGAEHYAPDGPEARWRHGYNAASRPAGHRGMDVDRWTWERKRWAWRSQCTLCVFKQLARELRTGQHVDARMARICHWMSAFLSRTIETSAAPP
jgi:hypothetical protein